MATATKKNGARNGNGARTVAAATRPIAIRKGRANGNGSGRRRKIRVAIIGVGNCANSLVQGVHYYRNAKVGERIPGLMHVDLGGYHIRDVEFVAAIDIDRTKVGKASMLPVDQPLDAKDVHVGPSDYVPWLLDRKWCYIRMEGTTFGDVPLNLELKLEVWDSPNSAGVVIDAIRCAKLALDRKLGGTIVAPASYFMKSPPQQIPDDEAHDSVEAFIRGDDARTLSGAARPAAARAR